MFTLRFCKPLPWLVSATLLGATGLAPAMPVHTNGAALICLPLDGHPGRFGCEQPAVQPDSVRPEPEPLHPPVTGPAAAEATASEVDEHEPAAGLVVLASVAAVLSLSLRRAAA